MHHWIGSSRTTPCFGVCPFMLNLPAALGLFNSHWEFLILQAGIEFSPPWWLCLLRCASTQPRLPSIPIFSCALLFIWGFCAIIPSPLTRLGLGSGLRAVPVPSCHCLWHSEWPILQDLARAPRAAGVPNPSLKVGRASLLMKLWHSWNQITSIKSSGHELEHQGPCRHRTLQHKAPIPCWDSEFSIRLSHWW